MKAPSHREDPFDVSETDRLLSLLHAHGTRPSSTVVERILRRGAFAAWLTGFYATHPSGRHAPFRSSARLWAWQLWRRTLKRTVRVELHGGALLDCPAWSKMAGAWVAVGLHEPGEMLFAANALRPGDLFVDVGANIGAYSVLALRRGAKVLAFEPTPRARQALAHNLALNAEPDRYRISPDALSDSSGKMRFRTDLESSNHLAREHIEGQFVEVNVSTLDAQLTAMEAPTVLKVDAEGFDAEVLRGATHTLLHHKPSVIAEIWAGGTQVRSVLSDVGYLMFRYSPANRELIPMPQGFKDGGYLIGVHRDKLDEVRERLSSAPVHWRHDASHVQWFPKGSS